MHKLKVLLINPPIKPQNPPYNIPLGLACIAAVIDAKGHDVAIFDNNAYRLQKKEVLEQIQGIKWDLISIGSLITTYSWQKEMFQLLRKRFPTTMLLAGGGLATSLQQNLMEWIPELDLLCVGEGERTVSHILDNFDTKSWDKVSGIYFRKDGKIHRTTPQKLLTEEELSSLPYPKFDLLPLDIYFKHSGIPLSPEAISSKRRLSIETSRGCPFQCSFCIDLPSGIPRNLQYSNPDDFFVESVKGKNKVRYYSTEWVIGLIKHLRLKYAIDFLNFSDENFTINKKHAIQFCDALEKEGLTDLDPPLYFGTTAHVNTIDKELLTRMKGVGFSYLDLGLESMNNEILSADIYKNATKEQNIWAFNEIVDAKIYPLTNFLIGLPHESCQSVYDLTKFLTENEIECGPFFVTPYPMTGLFEKYKAQILERFGSLENYVLHCENDVSQDFVMNLTSYNPAELLGIRQMVMNHDIDAICEFARIKGEKIVE